MDPQRKVKVTLSVRNDPLPMISFFRIGKRLHISLIFSSAILADSKNIYVDSLILRHMAHRFPMRIDYIIFLIRKATVSAHLSLLPDGIVVEPSSR